MARALGIVSSSHNSYLSPSTDEIFLSVATVSIPPHHRTIDVQHEVHEGCHRTHEASHRRCLGNYLSTRVSLFGTFQYQSLWDSPDGCRARRHKRLAQFCSRPVVAHWMFFQAGRGGGTTNLTLLDLKPTCTSIGATRRRGLSGSIRFLVREWKGHKTSTRIYPLVESFYGRPEVTAKRQPTEFEGSHLVPASNETDAQSLRTYVRQQ